MVEMSKKVSPETKHETASSETPDLEGSLDTIKEILVGEYTREVHKRIDQLEERTAREMKNSQESTTRMLDLLESFMKKEIEVLHGDLKSEKTERSELSKQAMTELGGLEKAWEKKTTQLADSTSERFHDIRDQVGSHFKSLSDEIARSQNVLRKELETAIDGLDARKTDRQFISALLIRMAAALQKDSRGLSSEGTHTDAVSLDSKGIKKSA